MYKFIAAAVTAAALLSPLAASAKFAPVGCTLVPVVGVANTYVCK